MRLGITGATGLIGKQLCSNLLQKDYQLRLFVRKRTNLFEDVEQVQCELIESPPAGQDLEGLDAVIHLAGESIAAGRWTKSRKTKIWESRIQGTRNLVDACLKLKEKSPKTFISASAVGYYGDRGKETLTEESPSGEGWLADLSKSWEAEALRMEEVGCRTVLLRIGIVLSAQGGALAPMLKPFRMGLGGKLGRGDQYMPWIHISDITQLIEFTLINDQLSGPVNAVSDSVTNVEFTRTLAEVLGRPSIFTAPSVFLKIALGEMAEALLLSGQKVIPQKALKANFEFQFRQLNSALRDLLDS